MPLYDKWDTFTASIRYCPTLSSRVPSWKYFNNYIISKLRAYLSSGEYKADLGFVHIIEYPEYNTVNTECI